MVKAYSRNALLMMGVVALASLTMGTRSLAMQVGQPLTPKKGVEAVEKAIKKTRLPKRSPPAHSTPCPADSSRPTAARWNPDTAASSRSKNSSLSASIAIGGDGRFKKAIRGPATLFVYPRFKGYAQRCYGPYVLQNGPLELGDLKLETGFTARIVIQNENGEPLSGVKIELLSRYQKIGGRRQGFGSSPHVGETSDAAGVIELDHLADGAVQISLLAAGYERSRREITFSKDDTVDWKMSASAALSGRLVDASGKGIEGVELCLARRNGTDPRTDDPRDDFLIHVEGGRRHQKPMAVSDANGHFKIDSLRSDTQYWLMTLHRDYRPHIISRVTAGEELESITLADPLVVKGQIKGELSKLGKRSGKYYLNYRNMLSVDDSNYDAGFYCTVDPDGHFEVTQLLAGQVHLHAAGQAIKLTVSESIDDFVIDLDKPVPPANKGYRPIRVVLKPTAGQPIRGQVQLTWRLAKKPKTGPQSEYKNFPAGETIDWEAPPGAEVAFQGSKLVGSIVEYTRMGAVPEGKGVHEFSIDIDPAGLTSGKVVEQDGSPIADFRIDVDRKERHIHVFQVHHTRISHPEGRFAIGPLPLGQQHQYRAYVQLADSWRVAISDPFLVTSEQPVFEQTIKVPPAIHLAGRVLNTFGEPAEAAVLTMSLSTMRTSRSVGLQQRTDSEGRFRIPISSELADAKFQFSIQPHQQSAGRTFVFRGDEFTEDRDFGEIRLQPSSTIRGFVLDEKGNPRSNVTVNLKPLDNEIAEYQGNRGSKSDANGAFEITGVERIPQHLYLFGKELVDATAPFRIVQDDLGNKRWVIEPAESEIDTTIIVK